MPYVSEREKMGKLPYEGMLLPFVLSMGEIMTNGIPCRRRHVQGREDGEETTKGVEPMMSLVSGL